MYLINLQGIDINTHSERLEEILMPVHAIHCHNFSVKGLLDDFALVGTKLVLSKYLDFKQRHPCKWFASSQSPSMIAAGESLGHATLAMEQSQGLQNETYCRGQGGNPADIV